MHAFCPSSCARHPSRRMLTFNYLSGTLPTQLGLCTELAGSFLFDGTYGM